MGSWGYKVGESDTFPDVYDHFFDQYNSGATPEIAAASVRSGSVFYFTKQGVKVSGRWIDSQKLEVTIEKGIEYSMKGDWAFFCGDKVDVQYKEV